MRLSLSVLLLLSLPVPAAHGRTKNADLYTLYDVTRNAQLVVQGTVSEIDRPRQVVTLSIEKVWHGKPEDPAKVRYEVRGSLDPYRVGRKVLEFLDPNLPYGTQDPKTIMAPLKPRSPRNRVLLEDPSAKAYAPFALQYLELTATDRGAKVTPEMLTHLIASLSIADDRAKQAAGESLHDLLTLSDRGGKLARELLLTADREVLLGVLMKAESGPGVPVMKLSMVLDEPALAKGMVHGSLYLPQSGIEARDSVKKALDLARSVADKAVREEYRAAKTDGYRQQLISVLAAIGGPAGEAFLWELVQNEKLAPLRKEALLAHVCLADDGLLPKIEAHYRKLSEEDQAELLGRIAGCREGEAVNALLKAELSSKRPAVQRVAALEAARRGIGEAQPTLEAIIAKCASETTVSLACLSALDGLRNLQTAESIASLEKAAASESASPAFREDARRFLEDIRRPATPGL